jgi:hypothetical protein
MLYFVSLAKYLCQILSVLLIMPMYPEQFMYSSLLFIKLVLFQKITMKDKKPQEEIIQGFNAMRNEQRSIAAKINELQQDLNEHKIVIETLDGVVDLDRKCFRWEGCVLFPPLFLFQNFFG